MEYWKYQQFLSQQPLKASSLVYGDYSVITRSSSQAWLHVWVPAEQSCPGKQCAGLAIDGGSEVKFKPLDRRLTVLSSN
ncbi:hypothetical protein J6590_079851 [Homalodisca vitripennis]|nr:hypothetical protein J6590_079851 [Homalodisca vitripennis]